MKRGRYAPDRDTHPKVRQQVTNAQQRGGDATFHAACLGCLWQRGNASGWGLSHCLGCTFSEGDERLPNLRIGAKP